ncbi:MAG: hypothetical protein CMK59_02210 [Proteobacteria bacterium]|nr:hypothetical protein [Pseudomonadota bacterium]
MPKEALRSTLNSDGALLATYRWKANTPKANLLVLHGMSQHAGRYAEFANHLCSNNIDVFAHDHRGHGDTDPEQPRGFFGSKNGWDLVLKDVQTHIEEIQKHSDAPLFILGHSMGSFIAQEALIRYGSQLSGALLSGSGGPLDLLGQIGRYVARIEKLKSGPLGISKILNQNAFEEYNKIFAPIRTQSDWLTRDHKIVDEHLADPKTGFDCTNQLWIDFLDGIHLASNPKRIKSIPNECPILIFSGSKDPVGKETRGLRALMSRYAEAGIEHINYLFYSEGRHEMLNETNREEVFEDIVNWIFAQLS